MWKKMIIEDLLEKQNGKCKWCGEIFTITAPPEIDHVQSKHNGGEDKLKNLQLLHSICNRKKGRGRVESVDVEQLNKVSIDLTKLTNKFEILKLQMIKKAWIVAKGNQTNASKALGITRRQINHMLYKYKLSHYPELWILPSLSW